MLIIRSARVVTPDGLRPATIHIADGRIRAVRDYGDLADGVPVVDAGDGCVLPGLVDTHVHVNEPGRTDWEGFTSATRAAAAGGVTTLLDMPLNSVPPTTTVSALDAKRGAAMGQCSVDVGFLGGIVPGNSGELIPLLEAGVFGFKCFLCPSGVDEFAPVSEHDLRLALRVLAGQDVPVMVHAELPSALLGPAAGADPRRYETWLGTRPVEAETAAVRLLGELAAETGVHIHVVHVSAPETLGVLMEARSRGARLTAETCPHYLAFAAEEIPVGATAYKCAPPIRDAVRRDGLWAALERGLMQCVVSDHSPAPPAIKSAAVGDFLSAWGGVAGLQLRLPAVWTGARRRGIGLNSIAEWLCSGPARLAGLAARKGAIAAGFAADLVIWRPEDEFTVTEDILRQRHPFTPWLGLRLAGVVEATYLAGRPVFVRGELPGPAMGRLLSRTAP